jgi:hypothetical protein
MVLLEHERDDAVLPISLLLLPLLAQQVQLSAR